MTTSGERNALGPDLVPVHHRIRDLLGRFPEGPLPAADINTLHDDVMRPFSGEPLPDESREIPQDRESRKRRRLAAQAALADILRSASAATADDLAQLTERLRRTAD